MSRNTRGGFTLIELLIVVVIIGILATIAIPKFGATKDKAKLVSVRADIRNLMSTMEGYASDSGRYITPDPAKQVVSTGNQITTLLANAQGSGYTITVTNATISQGPKTCTVGVATDAPSEKEDGKIRCT